MRGSCAGSAASNLSSQLSVESNLSSNLAESADDEQFFDGSVQSITDQDKRRRDIKKWFQQNIVQDKSNFDDIKRELENFLASEVYSQAIDMAIDNMNNRFLHLAVKNDRADVVKFLIEKGANCLLENNADMTPLYYATSVTMAQCLLNNVTDQEKVELLNYQSSEQYPFFQPTALDMAIYNQHFDVAKFLLIHPLRNRVSYVTALELLYSQQNPDRELADLLEQKISNSNLGFDSVSVSDNDSFYGYDIEERLDEFESLANNFNGNVDNQKLYELFCAIQELVVVRAQGLSPEEETSYRHQVISDAQLLDIETDILTGFIIEEQDIIDKLLKTIKANPYSLDINQLPDIYKDFLVIKLQESSPQSSASNAADYVNSLQQKLDTQLNIDPALTYAPATSCNFREKSNVNDVNPVFETLQKLNNSQEK